jgi:hypothetical protein
VTVMLFWSGGSSGPGLNRRMSYPRLFDLCLASTRVMRELASAADPGGRFATRCSLRKVHGFIGVLLDLAVVSL